MPVERVAASRRRKVSLACEPCRERKSRCDGGKPICASCHRRSFTLEQCVYRADNARSESTDAYVKTLHLRIRELEQTCRNAGINVPGLPGSPDRLSQPDLSLSGSAPPAPPSRSTLHHPTDTLAGRQSATRAVNSTPPNMQRLLRDPATVASTRRLSEWAGPSSGSPSQCTSAAAQLESNLVPAVEPESQISAMGTFAAADADLHARSTPEYFGHSSAASFLQQACPVSASSITSQNLAFAAQQSAGCTQSPLQLHLRNIVLPPRSLADHLLEAFWDRTFCLYPFFHRESFERQYERLWMPSTTSPHDAPPSAVVGLGGGPETPGNIMVFHCALNAIFALGCHFSSFAPVEREPLSYSFFLRAKAFIGLDLLEVNSLGVVQALLLTSLCLQSTPFPARCWNAVGVACRVAQGLGLHTEVGDSSRSALEIDIRRRTWHGCVHMDITVSMMLGRPPATLPSTLPLPSVLGDGQICTPSQGQELPSWKRFFVEAIKLNQICAAIMSDIYQPWLATDCAGTPNSESQRRFPAVDVLAKLDFNLSEFESRLPPFTSWTNESRACSTSPSRSPTYQRQTNVLHARFLHLKIMLYRPVFTFLCNGSQDSASTTATSSNPLYSAVSTHCALSCAIAAMDLLDHIYDTYLSSMTDAWWYNGLYASTAGIVVIMTHSCPRVMSSIDEARLNRSWHHCVDILQHLSTFSLSSKNQLRLLQRAYAQRVSDPAHPSFMQATQDESGAEQATGMMNVNQTWEQAAHSGSAWESQEAENSFASRDGIPDITIEGLGFFDSMNFFEGGFPSFISG